MTYTEVRASRTHSDRRHLWKRVAGDPNIHRQSCDRGILTPDRLTRASDTIRFTAPFDVKTRPAVEAPSPCTYRAQTPPHPVNLYTSGV